MSLTQQLKTEVCSKPQSGPLCRPVAGTLFAEILSSQRAAPIPHVERTAFSKCAVRYGLESRCCVPCSTAGRLHSVLQVSPEELIRKLRETVTALETPEVGPLAIPPARDSELGTKTKCSGNPELANSADEEEQESSGLENVSAGINCDPVSTVWRMDGKASENGRSGRRTLGLQMTKWSTATHQPEPCIKVLHEKEIHFNLLQTTELFWFSLLW
ncbi:uncharacterized protein LOC115305087 [Suricata suricatta]|uniref:uncharacterized protein LOC115305087 n=1 Tax=Suricata suricatta TaxID=37032 RepID=UPI00115535AC|nr:uncharacterized protein LOC115305087 [Suricata suricatta]